MIRRTNVFLPKARFDESEDFFVLVIECYVLVAVMRKLGMKCLQDAPSERVFPADIRKYDKVERRRLYLIYDFTFHGITRKTNDRDLVQDHSVQLLNLGMFYLNCRDARKEGDGERVLRSWKYMLPIFITTGRKNYAKEAFLFICQQSLLPGWLAL